MKFIVEKQDGTTTTVNADRAESNQETNRVTFFRDDNPVAQFVAVMGFYEEE